MDKPNLSYLFAVKLKVKDEVSASPFRADLRLRRDIRFVSQSLRLIVKKKLPLLTRGLLPFPIHSQ